MSGSAAGPLQAPRTDAALKRAIAGMAPPGVLIAHRLIAAADDSALLPEETATIAARSAEARCASGAARIAARELLARLGQPACPLPKAPSGAPVWPDGFAGSLSHDARVAVAAVARRRDHAALGIDIEPAAPLPAEMLDLVASARERRSLGDDRYRGRLLFAAKEAVYKALHPLDGRFLEFQDIEVDLAARRAYVRRGGSVDLRFCISTHLLALAFV
jgi:4'-phosphopantetheinyl transferase EntD